MKQYCLFFFLLSIVYTLPAQKDIAGSEDHPILTRYPGSYISSYEVNKFREYTISTGPITGYRQIEKQNKVEGKVTRITYFIDQPVDQLSIGEVFKDYKQALNRAKIELLGSGLFSQSNVKRDIGGGSWLGVALKPNAFQPGSTANAFFAGTSSSGGTFSLIGKIKNPSQLTYIAIYGERHSDKLVVIHVDVIEVQQAELGQVFADAVYIGKAIADYGSVSIYGIQFEFNSSNIQAESASSIEEIAKYLQTHPDISLYVVGHTDMKGTYEYNLKLSKDRAQALVDELVKKHQIDSSRLRPDGVAFLAPKATNQTEDGRALNRRTELVKQAK